ncbi:MAG: polysaccharide deacetylase family protein [Ectobacillus sp.]
MNEQLCLTPDCLHMQPSSVQKVAYLTFDDGPNRYTPQIMNILREKGVKATFFVIGIHIARSPQIMKQITDEGHYVGLHSMSHNAQYLYSGDPHILIAEMEETKRAVQATSGFRTQLIRVPYGSKPYLTDAYRNALAQANFKLWDWTVDTGDWRKTSTPASVLQQVMMTAKRNTEVILMHDCEITVQALPKIIDYLTEQGYTLKAYNPYSHTEVNFWHDARL